MPLDCIWSEHDESQLAWTQTEMAVYTDSRYGLDQRIVGPHHQAATVLHSWGNITNDCPCGCRKAFTPHRLLTGGARGFGLLSSQHGAPRHMRVALHRSFGLLLYYATQIHALPPGSNCHTTSGFVDSGAISCPPPRKSVLCS